MWLKSIVPSSDNSYIGKSTIQQNLYIFFSIKSNLFPNSILTPPAIFCAVSNSSAIKNIASLFDIFPISTNASLFSGVMNFEIPPVNSPFSSTFVQANPFAPNSDTANSDI